MSRSTRPQYEGDPTLGRVMLRPRWIAALLLALAVAGGFAWLGQWQLSHAITVEAEHAADTEIPRPLIEVTAAGTPVKDTAAGMVVTVDGGLVPGDFRVVEQRTNAGREGVWVTGHLLTAGGGSLAVTLGWAPDAATAERAIAAIEADPALTSAELALEGRYMPSDGAAAPKKGEDPTRITSMSAAQLVNLWAPFAGEAYPGYLVMHPAPPLDGAALAALGLEAVDSVPPLPVETISWLNLFYAVEWVVFAGFAVYLWYRLARDDWEKTHELQILSRAEAEAVAAAV